MGTGFGLIHLMVGVLLAPSLLFLLHVQSLLLLWYQLASANQETAANARCVHSQHPAHVLARGPWTAV